MRQRPVRRVSRGVLFFGALLGILFAWYSQADTGVSPGFSSTNSGPSGTEATLPAVASDQSEIKVEVAVPVMAADTGFTPEQSRPDRQRAVLQVSSLQEDYANQRVTAKSIVQENDADSKEGAGIPYAIILAMAALIGLVPVARRNGGS